MPDASTESLTPPREGLLPIRTVSALTGVNAVTIRAWERRYKLITPQRTPKGHRLYTHQNVERIRQIVALLKQGISVGHVKSLLELQPDGAAAPSAMENIDAWKHYQDRMPDALERFDEPALDSSYNDALSLYPVDIVNQHLTTPLLRLLGERWRLRETGIAEEHFFSVYLRNKLGARIHHLNLRGHAPLLLLACLPGELHEIGLLFFALSAVGNGYRVLILGANTPLQQIPAVLERKPCSGVVLSCSTQPAPGIMNKGLPELASHISAPVFVGCKATAVYRENLAANGISYLGENITTGLQLVTEKLRTGESR
jgi:DNA-binding transcriptional MerR regulator